MSRIPANLREAGQAHLEAQIKEIDELPGVDEGIKTLQKYQLQQSMDFIEIQTEVKLMNADEQVQNALNANIKA